MEITSIARVQQKTTVNPPKDLSLYYDSDVTTRLFHTLAAFVPDSLRPVRPPTITLHDCLVASGTHEGDVW